MFRRASRLVLTGLQDFRYLLETTGQETRNRQGHVVILECGVCSLRFAGVEEWYDRFVFDEEIGQNEVFRRECKYPRTFLQLECLRCDFTV